MYLATGLESFVEYLPVLLPLIIVEFVLMITALVHVLRHNTYRFGNKVMWAIIVVFIQIIGPVVYFVFGRGDE
ncbi:PLDc N-terminal domain-containing protein [Anaerosporobacter sp.]